jgi:hypothetical protein
MKINILKDEKSHKFLIDNGFTPHSSAKENECVYIHSRWLLLDLPIDVAISNFSDLFELIHTKGFKLGVEQGKFDAVRILLNKFTDMILTENNKNV